jgi:hypothetical protein
MKHSVMTFSLYALFMQIKQKKETQRRYCSEKHFRSGRIFMLHCSGGSTVEHDSRSPSKLPTNNSELQNNGYDMKCLLLHAKGRAILKA